MNKPLSVVSSLVFVLVFGASLLAQAPDGKAKRDSTARTKIQDSGSVFDVAPQISRQIPPVYPKDAIAAGVEGTVYVGLLVGVDGKPSKVKVLKSDAPDLNGAALDAVKKWLFMPATAKGKAVAATITIPVKFKLKDDSSK